MTSEYGWPDLDAANRSHYGRGKPRELINAEIDAVLAWDDYSRAVDDYYDLHYGDATYRDIVNEAQARAIAADARLAQLRLKYYPASEPVITPNQVGDQTW